MRELTCFDYFIGYGFLIIGVVLVLRVGWFVLRLLLSSWFSKRGVGSG